MPTSVIRGERALATAAIAVAAAVAIAIGASGCDFPWDFSRPYPADTATETGEDTAGDADADAPATCSGDGDCDDGIACTSDRCDLEQDPPACVHDFPDADGDGFGAASCVNAEGDAGDDCDDTNAAFHPGAEAFCEGEEDRNCDGFADVDGDGDGHVSIACGGDDCDPANGAVYPGATEIACDGLDNDCTGGDEGYGIVLPADAAVAASSDLLDYYQSGAVWTGEEEYALVWGTHPEGADVVSFVLVGLDGVPTSTVVELDHDPEVSSQIQPSIARNDAGFGVAWIDHRSGDGGHGAVYFVATYPTGITFSDAVPVSDGEAVDPRDPQVQWTGAEFLVAWHDSRSGTPEVYATRVTAEGAKVGPDAQMSDGGASSMQATAAMGVFFSSPMLALAWQDTRDGGSEVFMRFATTGLGLQGPNKRVTGIPGDPAMPSMAWSGAEYAIAWHSTLTGNADIGLTRMDQMGNQVGYHVFVTDDPAESYHPSIAWSGSEYGVAWEDTRTGQRRIWFVKVSAAGEKIGMEIQVSEDEGGDQRFPLVVWAGDRFGVFWHDSRYELGYPWVFYNAVGGCT